MVWIANFIENSFRVIKKKKTSSNLAKTNHNAFILHIHQKSIYTNFLSENQKNREENNKLKK